MIELQKYTVPTYDPRGLAENERTDFTRRIPAAGEAAGEWFDPEDDGDDEWMLGDTVPEVEDLDDMDDCYRHVITRDGIVERDEIYDLDQISEEWEKEHKED